MRKRLYYLPFLVMAFASLIFLCKPVFAVPLLQLDVSDGVYDQGTQTIVATGTPFTLYALLNPQNGKYSSDMLSGVHYISAALVPMTEDPLNLGFFDFDGTPVNVTNGMDDSGAPQCLSQPHGIYDTYFAEFVFTFGGESAPFVNEYNTQNNPGGFGTAGTDPTKIVYWAAFVIDTSGLDPDYAIHFDLYDCAGHFAPFSHDAQSRVPEPSTMLLLGSGLIGLGVLGRKKLFKRG